MKPLLRRLPAALFLIFLVTAANADEALLKPFILGSRGPGSVAEKADAVKTALAGQGFTVAGEYSPYPDAVVIAATNDELKNTAAKSERGGFGAAVRVSVTKVKDEVQVAYTNPVYMASAYRMQGDLAEVAAKLAAALGKKEEFGAKGLTAKKLRSYHYTVGMEYFDEPSVLAEYKSFEEAAAAVEAGLAAGKGGVTKVYRIDIPEKKETVFGVGMKAASDADKFMDDKFIMSEIDFKDLKSTAHLPYEMLVSGNKVYALYARFRIAISFPDLSMMGSNSFMHIMDSPKAIRKALTEAAGGKM
ncbi:MAG TPA: hypothetical protein VLG39_00500 [Nitrospirota bacterium]|nr:hypothetical protein [Nitrospirota bacterium]